MLGTRNLIDIKKTCNSQFKESFISGGGREPGMEAKLAKIRVPELQTSKAEISSCVFGIIFIIHCFETNYTKKKNTSL